MMNTSTGSLRTTQKRTLYVRYVHILCILNMRVSIWPIRSAGSWVYLAGSWREATLNFVDIF